MELKAQREAYGEVMLEAAHINSRVVALTADLADSTRLFKFSEQFPDRFYEMGVSEQAMIGVAVGLSYLDFVPFASSFGVFVPGRAFDHIRVSVAMNNANVRLVGSHLGLSNHGDGATAQAIEDIALMRSLPNITIISPADSNELKKAVLALVNFKGPAYLRMSRAQTPVFTNNSDSFVIGKAQILKEGKDVTVIGTGPILYNAIQAASKTDLSCEIINCHTIKPINEETIINSVKKTGCVVTVEEHNIHGGLGDIVAQVLTKNYPVPQEFIAIKDRFGQSSRSREELLKEYELDEKSIIKAIKRVLQRANQ